MQWCDNVRDPSVTRRRACPPLNAEGACVEHIHHHCNGCGYDDVTATLEVSRVLLRPDDADDDPHLAPCPSCRAPVGSLCRDDAGKPQLTPHPARRKA
jgi:hypothetical protein